jgi:hypothetical protein
MEYISTTEKAMQLVPYIIIIISTMSLFCLRQLKSIKNKLNNEKNNKKKLK